MNTRWLIGSLTILPLLAISGMAAQPFKTSERFDRIILKHSARAELDPRLVKAVIAVESQFAPNALSVTGARGLMQLMPQTALDMGVGSDRLYEPDLNIKAGTDYLQWLFREVRSRYGFEADRLAEAPAWALARVIAAYNGGPLLLMSDRWPRETQDYVRLVMLIHRSAASNIQPGTRENRDVLDRLASLGYRPLAPQELAQR